MGMTYAGLNRVVNRGRVPFGGVAEAPAPKAALRIKMPLTPGLLNNRRQTTQFAP